MKSRTIAIALVLLVTAIMWGQETRPDQHGRYKLELVLKQLDHGKIVSTHNFVMSAEGECGGACGSSQIRTGNRIPVDVGGDKGLQYMDVGFNCDARVGKASGNNVGLEIGWELSTMPGTSGSEKIVRQVRTRSTLLAALGKSTLVSSADDINSGQQFELWVTVTPEG